MYSYWQLFTPVLACAAAVVVLLFAEHHGLWILRVVAKICASTCFIWAAVLWGAGTSLYGQAILLGLVLCWFGDVLLIPRGNGRAFKLGIASFLLGHVAYAFAFLRMQQNVAVFMIAAILLAASFRLVARWLRPHVPDDFRLPVGLYLVVIAAMATLALGATPGMPTLAGGIGAITFAVSDLFVARNRFVSPGFINRLWGLPLYFAAQMLIASTVA